VPQLKKMRRLVAVAIFGFCPLLFAADPPSRSSPAEVDRPAVIPLGSDAFLLQPARQAVYLLASAESGGFKALRRVEDARGIRLLAPDGSELRNYPGAVNFRITATARTKLPEVTPFPTTAQLDLNDFLLRLRFQVKVFHGLESRVLQPEVKLIGMPAEFPYNERIFRVSVNLEGVSLADRVMLLVLSPQGDRVGKFFLDWF